MTLRQLKRRTQAHRDNMVTLDLVMDEGMAKFCLAVGNARVLQALRYVMRRKARL